MTTHDEQKAEFMQAFLANQHEISRKSIAAVSRMAEANAELITMAGINEIAAKQIRRTNQGGGASNEAAKGIT
jgi:hypothetical protein